jgi:nucleoside-diphosphate-sugar epimerase
MRIFLTGATGFIGSRIVPELVQAGHQVLGLTRSDEGAAKLKAAGAEVHRGTLEDTDSLKRGAEKADGVIHTAFDHDFSNFQANCEKDKRAIEAMGSVLAGSDRPLVITSGTGTGSPGPGQLAIEDHFDSHHQNPRISTELAGAAAAANGANVVVVRLPQVHDTTRQGLVTYAIMVAREKGVSAYVGDGQNRWPAAHVLDVAHLYKLVIERHAPGSGQPAGARYNAVAEEGIPVKDIAEVIGRGLKVPVVSLSPAEAGAHFGWLGLFAAMDLPASSVLTQQRLGWKPTQTGLIDDLEHMNYFAG